MRTLWDAVTPSNIPTNAELVAGYIDGRYAWTQAHWNRFPNSIKVTISVWDSNADVLDIETGDATPAMGPAWVARQRARGAFPTVYCNRSTWPAVQSALAAAGFQNGQHYDLWLADYTQVPHCPSYAAACQYADPGPYDLSLCQDYWPRGQGVDDLPYTEDQLIALVQRATAGIYARTDATYNGVKYGATIDTGGGKDSVGQPAGKVAGIARLEALEAKVSAPPAIDINALAAALAPHLPPSVDTKAVATAVVNEIGVRVRPPV